MRIPRLTILKKGLLLIALPVISQIVLLTFLFKLQHDGAVADYWALHTKSVLATAEGIFYKFVLAHSDARAAVLTGNVVFEEDSAQLMRAAFDRVNTLHDQVADNPTQQVRVERIAMDAADFRVWLNAVNGLVRDGQRDRATEKVKDLSGRRLLDILSTHIDEFKAEETRLDDQRMKAAEMTRFAQRYVMAFAVLATLGLAVIMVILFLRGVSGRITVLTTNARRLAEREPLPGRVGGDDEIAELDRTLHDAANRLTAAAVAEQEHKTEIEERVRELNRVNDELTQKSAENDMFVYSVSHDLRSPLVNLQGFGKELAASCRELRGLLDDASVPESLRRQLMPVIEQDMPDSLRFIQSAVTRSANIIDAMLRLSRAGRLEYRWQRIAVAEVVQRIVDSVTGTAVERKASFAIGELPDAWGDATAIEQVFANLIVNALNYTSPARPPRIEVGLTDHGKSAADGLLTYYVKDNGLGIPEAYVHKVFGAFQRLHGDVVQGEGIGLTLVRRIVERHGGRVWVESAEGVGSTFFVSLPANDKVRPESDATPA